MRAIKVRVIYKKVHKKVPSNISLTCALKSLAKATLS